MNFPTATYRIQFNRYFGFDQAILQISYLDALGISHLYASPCMAAVSGSAHGYDITAFNRINLELGGPKDYHQLCKALERAGLGQILDVVPNHMASHSRENRMWRDILAKGPESRFAGYFDVDWHRPDEKIRGKVLLPILGDHYDACLDKGELKLQRKGSEIVLTYFDHQLPLSPPSVRRIEDALRLQPQKIEGRQGNSCPEPFEKRIDSVLEAINSTPDKLDSLLELQHYRLAFWRTGASEVNYRRFFDINDLVGVRMEEETVFNKAHRLVFKYHHQGMIDGLRIDHPDGLAEPDAYFERLSKSIPRARIIVEKILEGEERLPEGWPVAGTTGYDFLNRVNGLFVDPEGERPLTRLYLDLTGEETHYANVVRLKKHQVLDENLCSEINILSQMLLPIRFHHRRYRDLVLRDLSQALKEMIACFPVYRTYIRPGVGEISAADRQRIETAINLARSYHPRMDERNWEFLQNLLLLRLTGNSESEFIIRFQQLTGPAMAKGAEDTAFYCFNRLISLNEVGGNPGEFGSSVDRFHEHCRFMLARYPETMSATATHDTKRGEDVRMRINLLSEIPHKWEKTVKHWFAITDRYLINQMPDANTRYFLFQTLVGAWPIDGQRLGVYMKKAVREAKVHTSWVNTDVSYEAAVSLFIEKILADPLFVDNLEDFVRDLLPAARISSLSQTLIKCTSPGIPDFYQGSELWDLNLVDPDNRRPVDFNRRMQMLLDIESGDVNSILSRMDSGLPKLFVIQKALAARRRFPEDFGPKGDYQPMRVHGRKAKHVVAFGRGKNIVTIAVRFLTAFDGEWLDTEVDLPEGPWQNVFTDEQVSDGENRLEKLLAAFPVALLQNKS